MDTIAPLTPITALTPSADQGGGHQQTFGQRTIGEILQATVLEARSSGQFILDFSGTPIPVNSEKNLSVGQFLQLQISQIIPQIELKILSEQNNLFSGKSLVNLRNNINVSALFSSLQLGNPSAFSSLSTTAAQLLNTFVPQDMLSLINSPQGGNYLQKIFNNLGMNFESLLAQGKPDLAKNTLKGALLEIVSRFQGNDRILKQAGNLLSTLELHQLAHIQLNNQNLLILPLPFPFLEQGYLLIDSDDKNDQSSQDSVEQQKFTLHLALTGIGNIRIDFLKNQDDIFIKLMFDTEEKAHFASQFSSRLENLLSSSPILSISFTHGAESPADSLVQKLLPDGESFINTKV